MSRSNQDFLHERHVKFLERFLKRAPYDLRAAEATKASAVFFIISGLDILDSLDSVTDNEYKHAVCDWLYSLQFIPQNCCDVEEIKRGGFLGQRFYTESERSLYYRTSHLAVTYCSLSILLILGDDLSRVNKGAILESLRYLQNSDGSFLSCTSERETDMRFVYCAATICYILNDWSHINIDKAAKFIISSISYDGGIGQRPGLESHGGSTFCGIAALYLMGKLDHALSLQQKQKLERWLLLRQESTFQGRPNKSPDTCYSFWVGAALKILGAFDYIDKGLNRKSVIETQDYRTGGFGKWPQCYVDLLHTYFGLAGLSLMNEDGLSTLHPALNITSRAFEHLMNVHKSWNKGQMN